MRRIFFASVALAAVASAACRQYDVDVYRNVNGRVRATDGVTESFVCTADSLLWAECFIGAANSGGQYEFSILKPGNSVPLYTGAADCHPESSYRYVGAQLSRFSSAPLIKGEEYVLKVTIPNSGPNDSINWYADNTNPYPYGEMSLPLGRQAACDLSARIEGINRPVSRELSSDIDVTPKCR